jgi:large subunit ribosomal protein L25
VRSARSSSLTASASRRQVLDRAPEIASGERSRQIDQHGLGALVSLGIGVVGADQQGGGRPGDPPLGERAPGARHPRKRTPEAHVLGGNRSRDQEPMPQPRRHRQVSVGRVRTPVLRLCDAPGALGLEHARRALDLLKVVVQLVVGPNRQILVTKLVERRSQRAHDRNVANACSSFYEIRHARRRRRRDARPPTGASGGVGSRRSLVRFAPEPTTRPRPPRGPTMSDQQLQAQPRQDAGKGVARKLRAAGRVPAVLYGHGKDARPLSVDARDLFHLLHGSAGGNVLIDLVIDGKKTMAMPREVQRDHIRGEYLHVDFLEVRRDEKVTVDVPIHLLGESVGVKAGGVLEHHLWDLRVECLTQDLPDAIEADISALNVNDTLRVGDLVIAEVLTVLTPLEESIASVVPPQARELEEAEVEGEAAAEEAEGATAEEAENAAEQSEE